LAQRPSALLAAFSRGCRALEAGEEGGERLGKGWGKAGERLGKGWLLGG